MCATTKRKSWNVYIGRCRDGSLYTGIALDVDRRAAQHNAGRGSKYVRSRGPIKIVWVERHADVASARRRECDIKRRPRSEKLALIKGTIQ